MPKILITGNGFDLHYGLPTQYQDFIKILSHLESNHDIDFESVYSLSGNYKVLKSNFKSIKLDEDKINVFTEELRKSLWYKYFKKELEIETWIDFEQKISEVVENIFKFLLEDEVELFPLTALHQSYVPIIRSKSSSNRNLKIKAELSAMLDFNIAQGPNYIIDKNYLIQKNNYYTGYNVKTIADKLIRELEYFKNIFDKYINLIVYPLYDNIVGELKDIDFDMIDQYYTFNYTPTFEKIFNKKISSNYLHGRINGQTNNLVLGVSDISEKLKSNKHLLKFTKYFQKINSKTDFKFINNLQSNHNRYNIMFIIIGHSLDESDKEYINEIFDFINSTKVKTKKIIITYHSSKSLENIQINLLDIRGKDDIINLSKDEILTFLEVDSNELDFELKKDISNRPMSISRI